MKIGKFTLWGLEVHFIKRGRAAGVGFLSETLGSDSADGVWDFTV